MAGSPHSGRSGVRAGPGPGRRLEPGWAGGGGSSGQKPCLASRPGHLLSSCVCSASQERKQDAFRWALGVPGLGGQLLGLATSPGTCLLASLYLPLSQLPDRQVIIPSPSNVTLGQGGRPRWCARNKHWQGARELGIGPLQPPEGARPPLAASQHLQMSGLTSSQPFCHVEKYLLEFWPGEQLP